ncbi:MAG TPA: PEGA domain-containing protein [Anaeromyxobacter sp.]|nr:PEGA domain-containing protein [Anaeromyxobacter sp.]
MTKRILAAVPFLCLAAWAQAAEPARVAFLGLRPAQSASFAGTAILKLPEAQRLRAVAENVVETLSGSSVVRHEELRAALGPTYLAELFECAGDAACQLHVAAPLRRKGIAAAFAGDYFAADGGLRIRLRRFDLAQARLADEAAFGLPVAEAESLAPWRAALAAMLQDTGSVRLATNLPDAACTLDGRPCELSAEGVIARVAEGEHVLELSRPGYRRATRVIAVKRREELRVALALEELPIQAQKAPDPNARVPIFETPGEATRVAAFGAFRLALAWDDQNAGHREDPIALPPAPGVDGGGVVVLPRPSIVGVTVQAPRSESGWQLRGAISLGWVKDPGPEIDSAFAEVVKEEVGFRLMLGFGQGIVSSLTAGTLTTPEGFGDLTAAFAGVTVSKSLGPLVLEGFVGRPVAEFSPSEEPAGSSARPFGAVHLAFVSERHMGRLYGEDYPLTVGISGLYGTERVGLADEQAWAAGAGVAAPALEDVRAWVASVEVHVPLGKRASLAGEAYVGEGAHLLEGALWQAPRVDPATGRHATLRSTGGWAQVSLAAGASVEVRLVAGVDAVDGLAAGLAPDGAPAVRRNRLAAANVVWFPFEPLALGAQLHAIETAYADAALGTATLLGFVLTSQLKF